MNDPRNLLLVVKAAEKRFDDLKWTLKPLVPSMVVGPEGQRYQTAYIQGNVAGLRWRLSVRRVE